MCACRERGVYDFERRHDDGSNGSAICGPLLPVRKSRLSRKGIPPDLKRNRPQPLLRNRTGRVGTRPAFSGRWRGAAMRYVFPEDHVWEGAGRVKTQVGARENESMDGCAPRGLSHSVCWSFDFGRVRVQRGSLCVPSAGEKKEAEAKESLGGGAVSTCVLSAHATHARRILKRMGRRSYLRGRPRWRTLEVFTDARHSAPVDEREHVRQAFFSGSSWMLSPFDARLPSRIMASSRRFRVRPPLSGIPLSIVVYGWPLEFASR
ncbi:hypothetical protein OF83DRAFT_813261 [Amylostereum chailletii]|nr:hypothetical protein OF83DRAFT_813261 [Amylostereum chailletii]